MRTTWHISRPVIRMDKLTTKVRIVMDGAGKPNKAPTSLNDHLLKGPKLINDLPVVLLRFRRHGIAVATDVKHMFHRILMREDDRDYHRFLWWGETGPKIFRWVSHPFGSAASPCIAIFTIKEHARRWRTEYPRAEETIIHSTLVDDNLDGNGGRSGRFGKGLEDGVCQGGDGGQKVCVKFESSVGEAAPG